MPSVACEQLVPVSWKEKVRLTDVESSSGWGQVHSSSEVDVGHMTDYLNAAGKQLEVTDQLHSRAMDV